MRKVIKIGLIVFASIAVCFGLIFYVDTVITDPPHSRIDNPHLEKMVSDSEKMRQNTNYVEAEKLFNQIMRKSTMYEDFGYISASDKKNIQEPAVAEFTARFNKYCFGVFAQPEWRDNEINYNKKMADWLLATGYIADYAPVRKELNTIKTVADRYFAAKNHAADHSFVNFQDAKNRIETAAEYAADAYLKNNAALVAELNGLAARIHDSHYSYLVRSIPTIDNIQISQFGKAHITAIRDALKSYKDLAAQTYGTQKDVSTLESRLNSIDAAAREMEEWENALAGNTIYDYNSYLRKYPAGMYAQRAKQLIQGLQAN